MQASLALTALVMGLAGGPHCAAMCGAACTAITRARGAASVPLLPQGRLARQAMAVGLDAPVVAPALWEFQSGRLLGYAAAGALAATAMQSLAWLGAQSRVLQPAWTLLHVAVLAWGVLLMLNARQPQWVESGGRALWARIRPLAAARGGALATGALWALLPCGLLYSALLAAALSGGPLDGALFMALFALASGLSLAASPYVLRYLQQHANRWRQDWGTRLAGLLLAGVALWALWMDLAPRIALWCDF